MSGLVVYPLPLSDQIAIELRNAGYTATRARDLIATLDLLAKKPAPPCHSATPGHPLSLSCVASRSIPIPVAEIHPMDARRSEVQPATRSDWKRLALLCGATQAMVAVLMTIIFLVTGGNA